jgi:DNA-binding NarL/FixJ family response regulator
MTTKWHDSPSTRQILERGACKSAGKVEQVAAARVPPPFGLSPGDLVILEYLARGLTDKAIALNLAISVYTVNKRVGVVLKKTASNSRTEAAIKAIRLGLV